MLGGIKVVKAMCPMENVWFVLHCCLVRIFVIKLMLPEIHFYMCCGHLTYPIGSQPQSCRFFLWWRICEAAVGINLFCLFFSSVCCLRYLFCLSAYTCVFKFIEYCFEINVQGMLGVDSASARPCFDGTTRGLLASNSPFPELAARGTSTNQIAASWMLQASRHNVRQTLLISL